MESQDFGKILSSKLDEKTDLSILSRWAYELFLDHQKDMSEGVLKLVMDIASMEDAVEFEYSIEELKVIAFSLQKGAPLK